MSDNSGAVSCCCCAPKFERDMTHHSSHRALHNLGDIVRRFRVGNSTWLGGYTEVVWLYMLKPKEWIAGEDHVFNSTS
jgi:hypothetical protein